MSELNPMQAMIADIEGMTKDELFAAANINDWNVEFVSGLSQAMRDLADTFIHAVLNMPGLEREELSQLLMNESLRLRSKKRYMAGNLIGVLSVHLGVDADGATPTGEIG